MTEYVKCNRVEEFDFGMIEINKIYEVVERRNGQVWLDVGNEKISGFFDTQFETVDVNDGWDTFNELFANLVSTSLITLARAGHNSTQPILEEIVLEYSKTASSESINKLLTTISEVLTK